MSPAVAHKSPTRGHSSRRSVSPVRNRGETRRRERSPVESSPHSRSPSRRERSPARHKSSHRDRGGSPVRERHSGRVKSPKRDKSGSSKSRSPSPRTKRLRKAQVETGKALDKEDAKGSDKSHDRDYKERNSNRDHKERDPERDHKERDPKRDHKERDPERDHKERNSKRDHKERDPERDHRDLVKETSKDRRERKSEKERERERAKEKGRVRDGTDGGSSRSRHRQSDSPPENTYHRNRHQSRSPPPASRSRVRDEDEDSRGAEQRDDGDDSFAKMEATEQALTTKEKQKPSFELSGKLAEETNRVRGVNLLFIEPPDARKPNIRWRLYVFKGGEVLNEPLYVHRQTCYLFGRERRVADIPTDHPSCSKQHAVLQYRQVEREQADGMMSKQVRPYLMDLGSTNKTFINDNPIEAQRYYELFEKDTIRFGNSSREYVLLHENSNT